MKSTIEDFLFRFDVCQFFLSSTTPGYLTSEDIGIGVPWKSRGRGIIVILRKWDISIDLFGLILILQLETDHSSIKCVCRKFTIFTGLLPDDRITVSSA